MTNLPVFFTSVAARAARLFMILEQTPLFSACSSAIAAAIAAFPMCLTAFLLPFMAFMGARDFGRAMIADRDAEALGRSQALCTKSLSQ